MCNIFEYDNKTIFYDSNNEIIIWIYIYIYIEEGTNACEILKQFIQ